MGLKLHLPPPSNVIINLNVNKHALLRVHHISLFLNSAQMAIFNRDLRKCQQLVQLRHLSPHSCTHRPSFHSLQIRQYSINAFIRNPGPCGYSLTAVNGHQRAPLMINYRKCSCELSAWPRERGGYGGT